MAMTTSDSSLAPGPPEDPGPNPESRRSSRTLGRLPRWWRSDYQTGLAALGSRNLLRGASRFIGMCCLGLAAATVILVRTPGGVPASGGRVLVMVVALVAVVAAALWWWRGWPSESMSLMFVAAADILYTTVLLCCDSPTVALLGTLWFFFVSDYLVVTHGRSLLAAHCLWVKANLLYFGIIAVLSGEDIAETVFLVLTLTASIVLAPIFAHRFADAIRSDSRRSAELAQRDPLTQLLNRRGLDVEAPRLFAQAIAENSTVAVLLLDVDRFKAVNDAYGHLRGDAVLTLLGERLQATVRRHALAARTGGEEFVVIEAVPPDGVLPMAERLRVSCHHAEDDIPITVSVGAVGMPAAQFPTADPEALLTALIIRADNAMYLAKAQGGNRVVVDLAGRTPGHLIPEPRVADDIFDKVLRNRSGSGRHHH